jgi:hypothetical protein
MTTSKPGIITPQEFNSLMVIITLIFAAFLGGSCFGASLSRKACEEVLESEVPIIYPHDATIEGGYLS